MGFVKAVLVLLLAGLLLLSPAAKIHAAEENEQGSTVGDETGGSDVGLVGEDIQDTPDADIQPAPGIETVYHFPNNPNKLIPAGEPSQILVGIANSGDFPLDVHSIHASLHLPFDYSLHVQNLTMQGFSNASVPPSVQASFPYSFTVNKYLQPGSFSLVASIVYEVDHQLYRSVFYNGTVEVVEVGGFLSGETVFLVTLGLGLVGLFIMWAHSQLQKLSKKSRKPKTMETGTRNTESITNEWLEGTAFTQTTINRSISQQSKSKKKK